jgi:hypothetical protein
MIDVAKWDEGDMKNSVKVMQIIWKSRI